MKIEQKIFSKTSGWEAKGECCLDNASCDLVFASGSAAALTADRFYQTISNEYPNACIILNTSSTNQKQHHEKTVELSAVSLHNSPVKTAVITISGSEESRKIGRRLASFFCRLNLKTILLITHQGIVQGIEEAVYCEKEMDPFTIITCNDLNISSLNIAINNLAKAEIKAIDFYEEKLVLNFANNEPSGIFELDRQLERSQKKTCFSLENNSASLHPDGLFPGSSFFPEKISVQNDYHDEERKQLEQRLEEKTKQLLLAEEALRKANYRIEQAQAALEIKQKEVDQFAYIASHDLQEPLRMITGFLAQLERKYTDVIDEKGKKYIHFAVDGAKRMRQIILDLLEFSRASRHENHLESIDLNSLINETLSTLNKQVTEKKATITVSKLPVINGYRELIGQVFQNLFDNALKFSRKNIDPVINVTSFESESFWQFAVTDNGIGINSESIENIFTIFQRLNNRDEYAGTGIGLAITKKNIEQTGGKIWVESKEGTGSTFYFSIPKQIINVVVAA